MPEIVVYPLPDQVADKVCAMYERYGHDQNPSTRYRDLIDIVLLVSTCNLDAAQTPRALQAESKRREFTLPSEMTLPAPTWVDGYRSYAQKTRIDKHLWNVDAAIEHVGRCLDPLLNGTRDDGNWIPESGWVS